MFPVNIEKDCQWWNVAFVWVVEKQCEKYGKETNEGVTNNEDMASYTYVENASTFA